MIDIDATHHSMFGERNVAPFSKYFLRSLYNLLVHLPSCCFLRRLLPTQNDLDLRLQTQERWGCDNVWHHPG